MAQKRKEELMEYLDLWNIIYNLLFFAGLMAWFVGKWVGRF